MKSLCRGVVAALITALFAGWCVRAQSENYDPGASEGSMEQAATATDRNDTLSAQPAAASPVSWLNARVASVSDGDSSIGLERCADQSQTAGSTTNCESALQVKVADTARKSIDTIHAGDHVSVEFQNEKPEIVGSISVRSSYVSDFVRVLTMLLAYFVVFLLGAALTKGKPLRLIVGTDQRYSNSQFQMALWFSVLLSTYIAEVALRVYVAGWQYWGGVNIAPHILVLSGVSALTFGTAKGITTGKVQAVISAGGANPKVKGNPNFFVDLVSNDRGDFDLGDFQMLVLTLLAVAVYVVTFYQFLGLIDKLAIVSLPDVDTTILSAFSLGQGAYLTKKAGGNAGTS